MRSRVASLLAFLLVACGGGASKKPTTGGGGGTTQDLPATYDLSTPSAVLGVAPGGSAFVISVDWGAISRADLYSSIRQGIDSSPDMSEGLRALDEQTGLALDDISRVVVIADRGYHERTVVIIIQANWDEAKFGKVIEFMGSQHQASISSSVDGRVTTWSDGGREEFHSAWLAADTVAVSQERGAIQAVLDGGGENGPLEALAGEVDTSGAVWGVGLIAEMPNSDEMFQDIGATPDSFWFTGAVSSEASAGGGLRFAGADAAAGAASMFQMWQAQAGSEAPPEIAAAIAKAMIAANGNDVVGSVTLDAATLELLAAIIAK